MTRAARGGRHVAPRRPGLPSSGGRHRAAVTPSVALRHALVPLVAVPALLLAVTTADAYWAAAGGGGTGRVSTGSSVALTVTADLAAPGALHPGSTSPLRFTLANPNPYAVRLTRLTAATVSSSDEPGCAGGTLALPHPVTSAFADGGHLLPSPLDAPAHSPATPQSVPILLTLSAAAPDACQGVTFTVALSFTGAQA